MLQLSEFCIFDTNLSLSAPKHNVYLKKILLSILIFLIRCVQYVELKVFAALTLVSLLLATVLLGRSVSTGDD